MSDEKRNGKPKAMPPIRIPAASMYPSIGAADRDPKASTTDSHAYSNVIFSGGTALVIYDCTAGRNPEPERNSNSPEIEINC